MGSLLDFAPPSPYAPRPWLANSAWNSPALRSLNYCHSDKPCCSEKSSNDPISFILCGAIKIGGKPLSSVKKMAEFLCGARSKFVHNAELMLEVGGGTNLSGKQNKVAQSNLSMAVLLASVEEGILVYFTRKKHKPPVSPGATQ